jgi:hypothetical protein
LSTPVSEKRETPKEDMEVKRCSRERRWWRSEGEGEEEEEEEEGGAAGSAVSASVVDSVAVASVSSDCSCVSGCCSSSLHHCAWMVEMMPAIISSGRPPLSRGEEELRGRVRR